MQHRVFGFFMFWSLALLASATHAAIFYQANNLAGTVWEYQYTVINDSLGFDLEEFTVFFDVSLYGGLINPTAPIDWDAIVIQPDPLLPDDGFYDALALVSGIAPGNTLSGFSVVFDYLGTGTPGAQPFAIVDPVTFALLDSGTTQAVQVIPEPPAFLVFASGLAALGFARRKLATNKHSSFPTHSWKKIRGEGV